MEKKKLYKARELAEILGVHAQTIYRAGQRGEIDCVRVGRSVRFAMPDTEAEKKAAEEENKA